MCVYIPPALWATGGLAVVRLKYHSPYPLPEPSIRSPWIRRGRTLLSLKYMNCPARASKSAVLNEPSCFLSGSLIQKHHKTLSEEQFTKIKQRQILRFVQCVFSLAPPATADNRSRVGSTDIYSHEQNLENPARREIAEGLDLFSWNSFRKN